MKSEKDLKKMLSQGIFLNLFEISLPINVISIMGAKRKNINDIKSLRKEIAEKKWDIDIYGYNSDVYAFSLDNNLLETLGFTMKSINLPENPKLTSQVIKHSLVNFFRSLDYEVDLFKSEINITPLESRIMTLEKQVILIKNFIFQIFYWRDKSTEKLKYGIIVDLKWNFSDFKGNKINPAQIKTKYGSNGMTKIAQIQREYLPNSTRLNTEISRQLLTEEIIPFIEKHNHIPLKEDFNLQINTDPVRVIVGE